MGDCQFFCRFETPLRYYEVRVSEDLLGDVTLETIYGGINNRLGQRAVVATGASILKKYKSICSTRKKHGYREVATAGFIGEKLKNNKR